MIYLEHPINTLNLHTEIQPNKYYYLHPYLVSATILENNGVYKLIMSNTAPKVSATGSLSSVLSTAKRYFEALDLDTTVILRDIPEAVIDSKTYTIRYRGKTYQYGDYDKIRN